jgi:hypothetical protein
MSQNRNNQRRHGGHPEKPAGTHNNSPEELAAINQTLIALSKKYDEANEKDPGRERWKFPIEVGTAVGIGIYTLITLGLFIASLLQLSSSSGQLTVMQDTEHRQLRAYVGINPGDVEDFGVASKQRVKFIRKNFGATPAYDVGFSAVGFGTIKIGESINTGPTGCSDNSPSAGLITMFPTVELPWNILISGPVFTPDQVQLVKSGDRQFVYWGTICYRDAFGAAHFTHYCWMYKGASMTGKDAEACLGHNDSD